MTEKLKKKELAEALGYKESTKKTIPQLRTELAEKLECAEDEIESVLAEENTPADNETIEEEAYSQEMAMHQEALNNNESAEEYLMSWQAPCGSVFDPNPDSACNKLCKDDTPEVYQKCLEKFQLMEQKKTENKKTSAPRQKKERKPKSTKKYDLIGDGVGTSASMINSMLICGASVKEMEDEIEVPRTRILGHFGGLKTGNKRRGPKEITRDKETGRYFIDDPSLDYYGDMNEEGITPVEMKEICRMRGEKVNSKKKENKTEEKPKKKVVKKGKGKAKSTNNG